MNGLLLKFVEILGSVLLIVFVTNGQTDRANAYLEGLVKDQKISGVAVAVLKGGDIVFTKNYGYVDLSKREAVTDNSQFGIMSISKNFVAVAVVQLSDKKLLDLDAPITKYLKNLPKQYDNVLIYQLLNHTAGVPDYVEVPGYLAQANRSQTPLQVLEPILNRPLSFKPGERSVYSNSGYFLLGLAIEKVSGSSLAEYLRKNIFEPTGMRSTFLDDNSRSGKPKTKGYVAISGELKEVVPLDPSQYWAAGGIVTTKSDIILWNAALRNGSLLPVKEISQMMQPSKLSDGSFGEFGLGFELMNTPNMKVVGYSGSGIGFNAAYLQFIDDSLTVIVLTNTSGSNSTMIAKTIRDSLLNKTEEVGVAGTAGKDGLDAVLERLFLDSAKGVVDDTLFKDSDALVRFKNEILGHIKSQGTFKGLARKGERKNPDSIVRRYQVDFEKGATNWIFIFSTDGKITIVNHM